MNIAKYLALALMLPGIAWGQSYPNPLVQATGGASPYSLSDWLGNLNTGNWTFNITAQNMLHWRKALATVRNGSGRGKLLLLGDSTTAGAGAGTGGNLNFNGAFQRNYPRALVPLLAQNVAISDGSFYDDQAVSVAYASYDPRVTLGTGWTQSVTSLSGAMFKFSTGTAGTLSFTPASQIDTIIVRYLQQGGSGNFAVNVDGGASLGTVTTAGASALTTATFTVTKGSHTINLVAANDAGFYIEGITAYDSTTPAIDLIQLGRSGASSVDFVTTGLAWSPMTALQSLSPDLTVICLTINDSNNGTALATYQASLQTMITAAKVSGDVILMTGVPSSTTQATDGTLAQYVAVMRSLAASNNVGMIDLTARMVSYAVTNPVLPYYDGLHPLPALYRDVAEAVFSAIRAP